jgi:hypothetical protein
MADRAETSFIGEVGPPALRAFLEVVALEVEFLPAEGVAADVAVAEEHFAHEAA